jgi:hypothetical protein
MSIEERKRLSWFSCCVVLILGIFFAGLGIKFDPERRTLEQARVIAEAYYFLASEDIDAGQVVVLDSSVDLSIKLSTTQNNKNVVGVAKSDISSGSWGQVIRSNFAIVQTLAGASRGDYLYHSTTEGVAAFSGTAVVGTFARAINNRGDNQYHPTLPVISNSVKAMFSPPVNMGTGSGMTELVDDLSPQLGGDLDLNGHTILGYRNNEYIEVLTQLGVPRNNLGAGGIDIRSGATTSNPLHVYTNRIGLTGASNDTSNWRFKVQLPSDWSGTYSGTNLYIYMYCNDRVNNTVTLSAYADDNTVDPGVSSANIEPSSDSTWQLMSDQLTGTYSAGEWIYFDVEVNLDANDYYYIGEMYIRGDFN